VDLSGLRLTFNDDFETGVLDDRNWVDHYLPQWTSPDRSAARYRVDADGLTLLIEADQPAWRREDGGMRVSNLQTGSRSGPVGSRDGQHRHTDGLAVRTAVPERRLWTPRRGAVEVTAAASPDSCCMLGIWLVGFEDRPDQSGEVCIAELFGNLRAPRRSTVRAGVKAHHDPRLATDMVDTELPIDTVELHSYAARWDADGIRIFVDDQLLRELPQAVDYPMQLMLDLFEFRPSEEVDAAEYPKTARIRSVRGYEPDNNLG
jgi:hypothetical protein